MKKTTTLAAIVLLAAMMMFGGCKKDSGTDGFFRLAAPGYTSTDKTTIDNNHILWEVGDVLYLNGDASSDPSRSATVQHSDGNWTAQFAAGIPSVNNDYLVCYPGYNGAGSANATTFSGSTFTVTFPSSITLDGTTLRCPMMGHASTTDNTIQFSHVCALLKVTLPTGVTSATIIVTEEGTSGVSPLSGDYQFTYNSGWSTTAPTLSNGNKTLTVTANANTVYIPIPVGNHMLKLTSDDIAEKTMSSAQTMEAGKIYAFTATVPTKGSATVTGTNAGRSTCGWVQLWEGGPKWAEFNVGATITDYANVTATSNQYTTANVGGLYTWGGTNEHRDGTTTDDHIDGRSDLTATNNTAYALWGSRWKMPTKANLDDLRAGVSISGTVTGGTFFMGTNTIWTWCDGSDEQYVSGCTLAGWKVSGKTGDYANNSIFLPAAGAFNAEGVLDVVGTYGGYWSSTADGQNHSYNLDLTNRTQGVYDCERCIGISVRAVLAD